MKTALASAELVKVKHPYVDEYVTTSVAVPGFAHLILTEAAVMSGTYCPCCSPSDGGKHAEHAFSVLKHAEGCRRFVAEVVGDGN